MYRSQRSVRNSFNSSSPSEAPIDYYPFAYGDEVINSEEYAEKELEEQEVVPHIGTKIDEVFDSYMEDSIFRLFCPQPLNYSPLALIFAPKGKHKIYILQRGFLSYALFGSQSPHSWLHLHKVLYQESLLDAGIYTPADLIVDPSLSHKLNRRSVYDAAEKYKELAEIRAGRLRAFCRFASHFAVYFIKGIFAGFGMYTTDKLLLPYLKLK